MGLLLEEALREAEAGNAGEARERAAEALASSKQRDIKAAAALVLARSGDLTGAGKLAEELKQKYQIDSWIQHHTLPTILAAIELQKNNPARAIEILRVAAPYDFADLAFRSFPPGYPAYIRGEAYLQAGQGQLAAVEFNRMIDHPGVVTNFVTGSLARLQLARAQAMMGDREAARHSYEDFLSLWKNADSDVPILKQARLEYGKLKVNGVAPMGNWEPAPRAQSAMAARTPDCWARAARSPGRTCSCG